VFIVRWPDIDAQRAHVVIEDLAQLVVTNAPDVGSAAAQVGEPGNGVRHRAARHLGCRPHQFVDLVRALLVDQVHRAGHHAELLDDVVIDVRKHVNDGVTDTEKLNVVAHLTKSPG
jgi:hypothetical protein